jgi:hypothetical protein
MSDQKYDDVERPSCAADNPTSPQPPPSPRRCWRRRGAGSAGGGGSGGDTEGSWWLYATFFLLTMAQALPLTAIQVGLPIFTTLFRSQNPVQLMTPDTPYGAATTRAGSNPGRDINVHVSSPARDNIVHITLPPPGSACPTLRPGAAEPRPGLAVPPGSRQPLLRRGVQHGRAGTFHATRICSQDTS